MMIKQHWLSRAGQSAGSVSSRAPPHRRPFSSFLESSSSRLPPNASFSTLHTPIENQSNSNPQKQSKWSKQVRRFQPLVQSAKQAASYRSYSIAPGTPRALRRRPETHSHVIRCTLRVLTGPHGHLDGHVPRSDETSSLWLLPHALVHLCTEPAIFDLTGRHTAWLHDTTYPQPAATLLLDSSQLADICPSTGSSLCCPRRCQDWRNRDLRAGV